MWRLGIDLGGTKTVLVVGDREGTIRAERRIATEPSGDVARDLERLFEEARTLVAEAELGASPIEAVGFAAPGPIDALPREPWSDPPNLTGVPSAASIGLRAEATARFGVPAFVENDANAATLAEWCFGAARGSRHAVYLTMSTGVGAGLVLGGRLHRGVTGNAGELGHVAIERDGRPCACGQRGCLEAYVGGAAWTAHLRRTVPKDSACVRLAGGPEQVQPVHVLEAAREGDAFARAEIDAYVGALAEGLAGTIFALGPEVIVLGTIVTAGQDLMLGPLRERVAERVWPILRERTRIVVSELGERLPALAALCVAFERGGVDADAA